MSRGIGAEGFKLRAIEMFQTAPRIDHVPMWWRLNGKWGHIGAYGRDKFKEAYESAGGVITGKRKSRAQEEYEVAVLHLDDGDKPSYDFHSLQRIVNGSAF